MLGTLVEIWDQGVAEFFTDPLARILAPTVEEVEEYQRIVGTICSRLGDVWGTCDGLNLCFEQSISQWIQRMFYIGCLHGHFILNVFVFAVDGTIPGVYDKFERVFEATGGKVIVDSAFKLRNNPFLIRTTQTLTRTRDEILFQCDAVKLCQSTEWRMLSFQSVFPRLRDIIK